MVNGFNKNTLDHCFLISTKAGGLGLNLPAASRVVSSKPTHNHS